MLIKDSSAGRTSVSDPLFLSTSLADLSSSARRTEQQAQSLCLAHYGLSFPVGGKQNSIITFLRIFTYIY